MVKALGERWGKEGLQDPPPREEGRNPGASKDPPLSDVFLQGTTDAYQQGCIESQGEWPDGGQPLCSKGECLGIASGKFQCLARWGTVIMLESGSAGPGKAFITPPGTAQREGKQNHWAGL